MPLLHYLQDFVSETLMWAWLAVFALGTLIERLWPAEKGQPLADLSLNIGYSLVLNWMLFTATPLLVALEALILNRVGLGLVALPGEGWALAASAAVYIVFMDFLEYLFHRAQHAWPILWAMHSFHHSDPSVNVTTTQRNFWLEGPIKLLALYPLAALLFAVPPAVLAIYAVAGWLRFFAHMNLRLSLGPFWPVVNGPQFHRIHHSRLAEHRDKNFATLLPLFDLVFGTHHRPAPDEFPATGLDTGEAPAGLLGAVFWPLRRGLRLSRSVG